MVSEILVADLIAEFLEEKNIDTVFGIIGSANAYIFDSINKRGYTKIVYMHHEQAAVMAAGAYYRASGKVSAAIVTAGGGASNAITGVITNWADSIPCLIISGQESTKYIKEHESLRMIGTQGIKIVDIIKNITKYSKTIIKKETIIEELEKAYFISSSDRPGPVWLDIPFDIQSQKINLDKLTKFELQSKLPNHQLLNDIQQVISLIKTAKRPLILAGNGIKLSNSKNKFENLINTIKIPTVFSWLGIDILPENNPYNFGRPGLYGQRHSNFVIQNCDLLIVLGCRLPITLTGYNINNFAPEAKIVMINNDKNELDKSDRYDIKIQEDVGVFIDEFMNLSDLSFECSEWFEKCKSYYNNYPTIEPHHIQDDILYDNSYVMVDKISNLVEENSIIVFEQGTPLASGHQAFKVKKDQTVFASCGLGEMGNGLPSSIGAWFGGKNKSILCLMADGSLMMNLQELQTIIGYKIPIKIILFNNDGYLFIKHTQKMLFDGRYTGVNENTGVSLPKFEKICNAFGIKYYNSSTTSLDEFMKFKNNSACMYECFMNPEQELSPKVKGIVTKDEIIAPPLEEMSPLLPLEEIKINMISKINPISYKIERTK